MREIKFRASYNNSYREVYTLIPKRKYHKGWYLQNGYIKRLVANHPYCDKRGYVMEHRLFLEEFFNRFLKPTEVVHHLDGNRQNNIMSNLELFDGQDAHASGHLTGKRNPNGRFVASEPIFEEIKFRFLNDNNGLIEIKTLSQLIGKTYRRGQFKFRGRFTDLKDKNGKDIYEGDILQPKAYVKSSFFRLIVHFKDGMFILGEGNSSLIKKLLLGKDANNEFEIIGNIYENPELLKDKL